MQQTGTIERYVAPRGFGFIKQDTGGEIFFHLRHFKLSAVPTVGAI
jgi:cold shock CspA family protein